MNVTSHQHRAPALAAVLVIAALGVACGSDDSGDRRAAPAESGSGSAQKPAEPPVTRASKADEGLANAVIVGKTAAPVTLKYDVATKPEVGQPFEVELTFLTRKASDYLEAEISGMPGLTIVGGGSARFEPVEAGGRYVAKVLARADTAGLYYIGIVAKVVSKVQTEARTFSIPLAVGTVPAAQKAAPPKDAEGEAIESMPATETTQTPGAES